MRIKSCHIDNFGKLNDITYHFDKDCTVICEENGWGKSTLAAFIRVMLYGFMNEGKRDVYENERKRFKPWQKGVYGGSLCFTYGEKTYQIRRVFGDKGTEDEFHLICQDTNLESRDFTEHIGEELFGINAEAFVRTVFITQNDCETRTTDGINAKIGNLAQNTNDINNFESAMKHLTEELNAMTPNRKTGSLAKKKARLAQLENTLRTGEASVGQTVQDTIARRDKVLREREELLARQKLLLEKQNEISAYKDLQAKQSKLNDLKTEYERRETQANKQREQFPGDVPTEHEILDMQVLCQENEALAKELEIYRFLPEEKESYESLRVRFAGPLPENEQLEELMELARQYDTFQIKQMQTKLTPEEQNLQKRLLDKYKGSCPTESEIVRMLSIFRNYTQLYNLLGAKQLSMQTIEAVSRESNSKLMGKWYLAGLLVAGLGVILGGLWFVLSESGYGVPIVVISLLAVLVFGGLLGMERRKKRKPVVNPALDSIRKEIASDRQQMDQDLASIDQFCRQYGIAFQESSFLDDLRQVQSDVAKYEQLLERQCGSSSIMEEKNYDAIREKLDQFLKQYKEAFDTQNGYYPLILRCRESMEQYQRFREKSTAYDQAYERDCDNRRKVDRFFEKYDMSKENDLGRQLSMLLKNVREHEFLVGEKNRARELLDQFCASEDMERLSVSSLSIQSISLEQLASDLRKVAGRLEELYVLGKSYEERLEQLDVTMEELRETRLEYDSLQEEIQKETRQYMLLGKTRSLLETAKCSFTNRYTQPLMKGFYKYYDLLGGAQSEFLMDASTKLQIVEGNLPRDPVFLSTGKRDLIGICMRMALVEAMYGDEKPFLIMDDPFVNLDEVRTSGGLALLDEIAKNYQVIYFTCHNSRC